jgi:transcriptional regulator with PAS, ATPase and Fis domain
MLGDYSTTLPEQGNDEIAVFTRTLNTLSAALRERIAARASQQRLLESEARFKTLFDMAPLPLTVSDRAGRIIAANRAVTETFGHPVAELIGKRSKKCASGPVQWNASASGICTRTMAPCMAISPACCWPMAAWAAWPSGRPR